MGNNELIIEKYTINDLPEVCRQVIEFAQEHTIWIFDGEMGAGKTTTISAMAKELNIIDNVSSPTFSIVNEYIDNKDNYFYHFDFYRIKNEVEAMDIGVDEYFYSGHVCFLEWASLIPSLLPEKHIKIEISIEDEKHRTIKATKYE
ncbi:tRNA (adenosine(37)-N6)-threonylcarbamoyltransferase complex ATPase subunit type 1 TsaE [Aureibacter tunicatorum]|uniref:tRNA threonylcarbamoyladenosine biosynthesis protein TsaE n=1 Tax=Aureibacter tunicatorum TaxID=866807 RepID=A0AAE3XQA1_9BACT|nr:tRNA (adenosine(37)-N6)-threonylcarbamoyltransferase complex ATPase subunit type 1 TsaE [Aureibacter tunicatorum]MDR6242061.1 tRNA threonylcarbamoyladenosine biosynthesis protein TsaE [Aureibacter tunicatorum]BDD03636.1 tRNA (adenosine(37)-N6)-threonylcarbamoyltransferase complex ATPase subunit type 1 TsaE [Aureibacter tunicatorum]